jgi:putative transposase
VRRCRHLWSAITGPTLPLVWAVLDRAAAGWRGVNVTSDGLQLLQGLRRSLLELPRQLWPRTVTATQPDDQPETVRGAEHL